MAKVLYIGGTGEISYACVLRSVEAGHDVSVFNRGRTDEPLGDRVTQIVGDMARPADYEALAERHFDVVCQFVVYTDDQMQRDLDVFAGQCGQYVFISSASCYQKPLRDTIITEQTPLENPYLAYSRNKIACERSLMRADVDGRIRATVVRPSHTFRRRFPGGIAGGDDWAWRILNGRPIIVQGDGTTFWTWTHASDFAVPFVNLLANERALGEDYHITRHMEAFTWNDIFTAMGNTLGHPVDIAHVPTEVIGQYNPDWLGPLMGDKSWSAVFDNSKVMDVAGHFECKVGLEDGMTLLAEDFLANRREAYTPDEQLHARLDSIAADQRRLGDGQA